MTTHAHAKGSGHQMTPRDLEHRSDCPSPQVVRHDGTRFAQLTCHGCAATVVVPRRSEWREATR